MSTTADGDLILTCPACGFAADVDDFDTCGACDDQCLCPMCPTEFEAIPGGEIHQPCPQCATFTAGGPEKLTLFEST